jgi:hypothetical protein
MGFDFEKELLVEPRCNLDHLITNCPSADPKRFYMHFLQICGKKCDIGLLRLVDEGLYISEKVGSLDIPMSVVEFAEKSVQWVMLLFSIKVSCLGFENFPLN